MMLEMMTTALEHRKTSLEELERSEAEARRLDSILDNAINRVKVVDSDSEAEPSPPGTSQSVPTLARSQSHAGLSEHQQQQQPQPQQQQQQRTLSKSSSGGFFGALSHTFSNVVDQNPEVTRRNNIGKTRENISHLEQGVTATANDLRYASQYIQADLDRFQRQKVADLREMSLDFARLHKEWCEKNLQLWSDVKADLQHI